MPREKRAMRTHSLERSRSRSRSERGGGERRRIEECSGDTRHFRVRVTLSRKRQGKVV
jgi:hypothetical protein